LALALTLSELARWVEGDIVRGGLDLSLTGMAALDAAGPGDVSFLGNDRYHGQFLTTKAAAVIVPTGVTDGPENVALIAVENPSLAFATVVRHFAIATRSFAPGVHPSAFVDPTARLDVTKVRVQAGAVIMADVSIGDGSDIGPNSVIAENVVIGQDCRIMANVSIRERCVLGDRVILQPGVVVGSDGYGYEFSGGRHVKIDQVGIVEIGNDVEIGANSTIDRARFGKTTIGEGTKIDNLVQIGHNCVIGRHCLVVALTGIAGSSRLEDYVTIAGQVGVAGHVTVGSKAILSARTGVTKSIPGGQVYAGNPAQPIREDMKFHALVRRLPKLIERVKSLEEALRISRQND
jgi:UDP-3-O-[3-hydroxymyristoyl] glucosamine N-acyltransferase